MFGQQVTDCRRRLARTCASPSKGRCLTALLDLRAPGQDPALLYPRRTIDFWLTTWQAHPDIRRSIRHA
eukprot:6336485-Pyramimonas_sp.AAC.1